MNGVTSVLRSTQRPLASLVDSLVSVPADMSVSDISMDSRQIGKDGLFLACHGRTTHGLQGLQQAIACGARAVLWEPAPGIEPPDAALLKQAGVFAAPIDELSRHAGAIAARFFDDPSASLQICGITGTNGKTTTAWLLAQLFEALGMAGAYVGTLGAGRMAEHMAEPMAEHISGAGTTELSVSGLTTADAVSVQRQLATLRAEGARHVAMEVSSHALDQHRVDAVQLQVAVFTNLSRDHLDYHGSMEAYAACKTKLFAWPRLRGRVINVDDAMGRDLARRYAGSSAPDCLWLTSRSDSGSDYARELARAHPEISVLAAESVQPVAQGMRFTLTEYSAEAERFEAVLQVGLLGEFNIDNLLAAIGVLRALDISLGEIVGCMDRLAAPVGRMQAITTAGRPLAIVDYAHTPDALEKALLAARRHCTGKLHVVFGCGGERDRGKRSLMGQVAAQTADEIILTDDNPRSEPPVQIIEEILRGIRELPSTRSSAAPRVIHDRRQAIHAALGAAREGDVVLIAGKGHEDYQLIGSARLPASDQAWVREALQV